MPRKKVTPKKEKEKTTKRKKPEPLTRVTGMHDLLPDDFAYIDHLLGVVKELSILYDYMSLETPVLEKTALFEKSIGKETDIVGKEMFTFSDKGGKSLTLRPEWTASVARAYVENGMASRTQPVKLVSYGPLFRRERPQAGRFRQFHQVNFEAIGNDKPVIDAEVIFLTWNTLKRVGLEDIEVHVNSIGCVECRPEYRDVLINYFSSKRQRLCSDCKKRLRKNPLRILDCKNESCQAIASEAPQSVDYLCQPCHDHFKDVLEYLDEVEVVYNLNPNLVRGLDYYTKTTFEIVLKEEKKEGEKENSLALAGGGRYDGLIKMVGGGEDTTGIGVALGVERIIDKMKKLDVKVKKERHPDVYFIQLGELAKKKGLRIYYDLFLSNIKIKGAFHKDSIKSQLRQADKKKAKLSLILGQKEALEDSILIRDMTSGIQEVVPLKTLVKEIKERLKKINITKKS